MKPWKIILIAVSAFVLVIPLTAYAAVSLFTDVPDNHIFVDDINWMKTAGVTNGCGDGTTYCPEGNVTRGQMAAFMHRLATGRSVDAGTLDGRDSSDFLMNAEWMSASKNSGVPAGGQIFADVTCPLFKWVTSGGGQSTYTQLVMTTSMPINDNKTWRVTWTNTGPLPILSTTVTAYAMCAGPGFGMIVAP